MTRPIKQARYHVLESKSGRRPTHPSRREVPVADLYGSCAAIDRRELDFSQTPFNASPVQRRQWERACKTVCESCPVRAACLAVALANDAPTGIWGGCNPDERAALAGHPAPSRQRKEAT